MVMMRTHDDSYGVHEESFSFFLSVKPEAKNQDQSVTRHDKQDDGEPASFHELFPYEKYKCFASEEVWIFRRREDSDCIAVQPASYSEQLLGRDIVLLDCKKEKGFLF
jgi:hypothetical protein